jgi:hypothetical protein
MALDEQLIARSHKRQEEDGDSEASAPLSDYPEDDQPQSLREAVMASRRGYSPDEVSGDEGRRASMRSSRLAAIRRQRGQSNVSEGESAVAAAITAPAQRGLSRLLAEAWKNLISSYGLTLIWINTHFFMRSIGTPGFCDLGEEWVDGKFLGGQATNNDAVKEAGKKIGLIEKMGLFAADFLVLIIILAAAVIIMLIVEFFRDPLGNIGSILKLVFGD